MKCSRPVVLNYATVGCGQCMSCRINRKRMWTGRLLAEHASHPPGTSLFATLTYADESLPLEGGVGTGTLRPDDLSEFFSSFRRLAISAKGVRFFGVGEYGDRKHRPHYHVAIFGAPPLLFPENCLNPRLSKSRHQSDDDSAARSRPEASSNIGDVIQRAWHRGFSSVSEFNATRAAYVAHYVTKRMTLPDDPRLAGRHPEFTRMTRRPALGDDFMRRIAAWCATRKGAAYLEANGDVPQAFRMGGTSYPIGPRHQRLMRRELGLPEKRTEVKASQPHREWPELELPDAAELNRRLVKEDQHAKRSRIKRAASF